MIKSVFFAHFHPVGGPRVLHQVPEGSVIPVTTGSQTHLAPLIDFSHVADFIIPKQEFCDRLVTACSNGNRVVGYPVCIANRARYDRNEFMFNMAFILDETCEIGSYASVVRKLARGLRNLEEQASFLSCDQEDEDSSVSGNEERHPVSKSPSQSHEEVSRALQSSGGAYEDGHDLVDLAVRTAFSSPKGSRGSKVYALCEMILEDLNNYCECMIPIDDSNTVNLKLFPTRPSPPPIHAHHVPLLTIPLPTATSPFSQSPFFATNSANLDLDLTLLRLLPHITGTYSISQLAHLADVDLNLARKAVAHLLYYGCVVLLDVFHFGAVYAPTAQIGALVQDEAVQRECKRYVTTPSAGTARKSGPESSSHNNTHPSRSSRTPSDAASREWWDATGGVSQLEGGQTRSRDFPTQSSDDHIFRQQRTLESSTASLERSLPHYRQISARHLQRNDDSTGGPDAMTLIALYSSLRQGLPLRAWCLENSSLLVGIDVRRFITFGVIKGLLYRVHRYAIGLSSSSLSASTRTGAHRSVQTPGKAHPSKGILVSDQTYEPENLRRDLPLSKYLDGNHSFDEICTDLEMPEKELMLKLKGFGEVHIINR